MHPQIILAIRFIRRVILGFARDYDDPCFLVETGGVDSVEFPPQEGRIVVHGRGLVRGKVDRDGLIGFHLDNSRTERTFHTICHIVGLLVF